MLKPEGSNKLQNLLMEEWVNLEEAQGAMIKALGRKRKLSPHLFNLTLRQMKVKKMLDELREREKIASQM